jgi:drug/metabolite transporter (DMT)-like permease
MAVSALAAPRVASPGRAIACMATAVALFTIMDGFIKWLGGAGYPTMQLVFFRSLFAFVPLSIVLFRNGAWRAAVVTRRPWSHLLRCLAGCSAMAGFFYSYSVMPLADAVAIGFAAPIFVTALSVPLLGEKVGIRRWSACLVGFAGVLVIVQPGPGLLQSGALFALGATVAYAVAAIWVRRLARTEANVAIVFYFTLCTTLVSACFLPWQWVTPNLTDLGLLVFIGLLGGTAQLFMTEAFRHGEVGLIMPFEYTAMIWSVGIGYFVWQDIPGLSVWLGAVLVIAAGLYIVYRETHLRKGRD